jgi:hypothetical protein
MARRLVKQTIVAVRLPKPVVEVPVFATRPEFPTQ